jgi:hypothetical protein
MQGDARVLRATSRQKARPAVVLVLPGHDLLPLGVPGRGPSSRAASSAIRLAVASARSTRRSYNQMASATVTPRTRDQVARFFTGLDLLPPGLVPINQWALTSHIDATTGAWSATAPSPANPDPALSGRSAYSGTTRTPYSSPIRWRSPSSGALLIWPK